MRPVLDFAEIWFHKLPVITFHDPLAAAAVFNPALCRFTRGCVTVDARAGADRGVTRWMPEPKEGPHEVALAVDAAGFFDDFFRTVQLGGENSQ